MFYSVILPALLNSDTQSQGLLELAISTDVRLYKTSEAEDSKYCFTTTIREQYGLDAPPNMKSRVPYIDHSLGAPA